jgi:crossover junction endodeoxyribonuclease RuvC
MSSQNEEAAKAAPVRVMGIDPGTLVLGYGVVERAGSSLRRIASGVVVPAPGPLADRLAAIFAEVERVIDAHRPAVVAIEDLFHARNAKAALTLGHARGVALCAAGRAGLVVHAYAPPLVKKAVVGHGRAEKFQVQRMVGAILAMDFEPRADEADALAVALCHCQRISPAWTAVCGALPADVARRVEPAAAPLRAPAALVTPIVSAADLRALAAGPNKGRGRAR